MIRSLVVITTIVLGLIAASFGIAWFIPDSWGATCQPNPFVPTMCIGDCQSKTVPCIPKDGTTPPVDNPVDNPNAEVLPVDMLFIQSMAGSVNGTKVLINKQTNCTIPESVIADVEANKVFRCEVRCVLGTTAEECSGFDCSKVMP